MHSTLKSFYQREDKFLVDHFGPQALDQYREDNLKVRTALLSMFELYSGKTWEAQ